MICRSTNQEPLYVNLITLITVLAKINSMKYDNVPSVFLHAGLLSEVWRVKKELEEALEKETHMDLYLTTKAVSQWPFSVSYFISKIMTTSIPQYVSNHTSSEISASNANNWYCSTPFTELWKNAGPSLVTLCSWSVEYLPLKLRQGSSRIIVFFCLNFMVHDIVYCISLTILLSYSQPASPSWCPNRPVLHSP